MIQINNCIQIKFSNIIKQDPLHHHQRPKTMQTDSQKDSSTTPKGDIFASTSLTAGYFYDQHNDDHHEEIQHPISQLQAVSQQQLMTPQQSSRRRPKPSSHSKPQPSSSQILPESQSPQRKSKHPRRTYKKTANKRNIQQLQQQLQTLDDEQLQKHDLIMLSKESGQGTERGEKQRQEVFQLDDLEAEYEVEQVIDLSQEKAAQKQNLKLQQKKRKLPLKVKEQVVFEQSSDQQQQPYHQQGQSPQRLKPQPKLIPESSSSLSSPQKQSPLSESPQPQQPEHSHTEITRQHMFKILTYPVKANMLMRTNLERVNGFIFNTYPEYHVYFESDKTHLLSAKRVSRTPFSTFIISRSKTDFEENSENYMGKAKGSALGDILNLFGQGLSPANALLKKRKPRQLLATIIYQTRIILAGQPRNFKVYIKKHNVDYYQSFPQVKIYGQQIPLNLLYQNPHNRQFIIVLSNKQPTYNAQIKGYSLNFRGRVGMASVKNFILEKVPAEEQTAIQPSENADRPMDMDTMIFGKSRDNIFNMDLSSPLSPLIAFGVALSTFDEKYFCE